VTDGTVDGQSVREQTEAGGGVHAWLTIYLKGAAMGAADTVPGVSGGTIALITGVYERLITAIAALDPRLLGRLRGVGSREGRRRLWRTIRDVDLPFLVVLGLGAISSLVVLSRFMHTAVVDFPTVTYAFFFGLIAASAVVLYGEMHYEGLPTVGGSVAGFLVGVLVAGGAEATPVEPGLPVVFLVGAVTITALVLPGVSGAFILLLLGQYTYLTGVLEAFVDGLLRAATGGSTAGLAEGAGVVAAFAGGAVVGLLSVAHAIRWALDRQRAATLAFLVSLMVGSLRMPMERVLSGVGTWTVGNAAIVLAPAVVGGIAVIALDRFTDDLDLDGDGR
jgi:putative membrane protein